jgi:endoribonuclease Dicer
MIISLARCGFIDENLMSTFKKLLPAFRNAQLALHEKKGSQYSVRIKPSLWEQGRDTMPNELYLTILDVSDGLDRPYQPLGLLTRTPMPDFPQFPLFLLSGKVTTVLTKTLEKPLAVNSGMVEQIAIFTHRLWKDINNKVFDFDPTKLPYWVVPAIPRDQCPSLDEPELCIDWAAVLTVNENEEFKWTPSTQNESLNGKFVLDRDSGGGRFFLKQIEPSLTPLSPVPEGLAKPWGPGVKFRKDILDYSNSLWGKGRAYMRTIWQQDQPVFEAELVLLHQNMLAEPLKHSAQQDQKLTKAYLCPEPLRISAVGPPFLVTSCRNVANRLQLTPTVVAMWLMFPAIIHRLEDYLIALEACEVVDIKISASLALEAITKDSDNSGEHNNEQVNFRPGMGNNYERLEFIGDCFLKMATSISLFAQFPEDSEFNYHVKRMLMICNQNLFNTATRAGMMLPEFVRSLTFDR